MHTREKAGRGVSGCIRKNDRKRSIGEDEREAEKNKNLTNWT